VQINTLAFEGNIRLSESDMCSKTAGAGCVIRFHEIFLSSRDGGLARQMRGAVVLICGEVAERPEREGAADDRW
jgi:hypothetical protein